MIESNYILYAVKQYQKLLKKTFLVAKNRRQQLNQVKILRLYLIVYKKKNQVKLNFIYSYLVSEIVKKKSHYLLQKIEDYNLTKQKYFEYIQLYKKNKNQVKKILKKNSKRK